MSIVLKGDIMIVNSRGNCLSSPEVRGISYIFPLSLVVKDRALSFYG